MKYGYYELIHVPERSRPTEDVSAELKSDEHLNPEDDDDDNEDSSNPVVQEASSHEDRDDGGNAEGALKEETNGVPEGMNFTLLEKVAGVLKSLQAKKQKVLVLVGAGMSTAAGLPDFRSEGEARIVILEYG